MPTNQIYLTAY